MPQDLSDDVFLVVTPASGRAEALVPAVRAAISRVDREQLVSVRSIMTLEDIAWTVTGRHRFRAVLVIAFAALALVLAMVGLFGILAYSVQQHVRDFGVRRALGATTGDVLRVVIVNAVSVIAAGAAIDRGVRRLGPLDPERAVRRAAARHDDFHPRHAGVGGGGRLSVVGPAWRVARIDPAAALRNS